MSRIGKTPVVVPDKVKVRLEERRVFVEGPKGKLDMELHELIKARMEDKTVYVERAGDSNKEKAMHGTMRKLVANMIQGVNEGFKKELEIQGVGFRATVKGKELQLNLGKSHPVNMPIPEGLKVTVQENVNIAVEGVNKELVGKFAAEVRALYPAEPYKGKGVRYKGEQILRKEGKTAQSK